eukprot:9447599-Pyramimonas_sp.AAC.1
MYGGWRDPPTVEAGEEKGPTKKSESWHPRFPGLATSPWLPTIADQKLRKVLRLTGVFWSCLDMCGCVRTVQNNGAKVSRKVSGT